MGDRRLREPRNKGGGPGQRPRTHAADKQSRGREGRGHGSRSRTATNGTRTQQTTTHCLFLCSFRGTLTWCCPWPLSPSKAEGSCCGKDHTASKVQNVYDLAFHRKSAGPLTSANPEARFLIYQMGADVPALQDEFLEWKTPAWTQQGSDEEPATFGNANGTPLLSSDNCCGGGCKHEQNQCHLRHSFQHGTDVREQL